MDILGFFVPGDVAFQVAYKEVYGVVVLGVIGSLAAASAAWALFVRQGRPHAAAEKMKLASLAGLVGVVTAVLLAQTPVPAAAVSLLVSEAGLEHSTESYVRRNLQVRNFPSAEGAGEHVALRYRVKYPQLRMVQRAYAHSVAESSCGHRTEVVRESEESGVRVLEFRCFESAGRN